MTMIPAEQGADMHQLSRLFLVVAIAFFALPGRARADVIVPGAETRPPRPAIQAKDAAAPAPTTIVARPAQPTQAPPPAPAEKTASCSATPASARPGVTALALSALWFLSSRRKQRLSD